MVVTRVTEICLGILAVTLVDSVLFPSSLAPVLRTRLKGWLADLARWQEGQPRRQGQRRPGRRGPYPFAGRHRLVQSDDDHPLL